MSLCSEGPSPWQGLEREAAFDRFLETPQGLAAATSTWQGSCFPDTTHFPRSLGFTSFFQDTKNNAQKPLQGDTNGLFVLGWAGRSHVTEAASSGWPRVHLHR